MKLKPIDPVYPKDTNLLQFMFLIARDDGLLSKFLTAIEFMRNNPHLKESETRMELALAELATMSKSKIRQ